MVVSYIIGDNVDKIIGTVSSLFDISGQFVSATLWGQGNINDTYLVTFDNNGVQEKYIIQRINHNVFKNVPRLMDNVVKITEHIRRQMIVEGEDPSRNVLQFIKTKDNKNFIEYEDNFYRAYHFIDKVMSYQVVNNVENFYESAVAFGRFQKYLANFSANELYEIIPDFHNTRARYDHFIEAVDNDVMGRAKDVSRDIQFVKDRELYVDKFVDMLRDGTIPTKVAHNDTKINNVLLDEATGKGICVIDLDTVMPGSILYDFGDSIRSGCLSGEEDSDYRDVQFRLDYFENYAKGFLNEIGDTLTPEEIDNLAFSGLLMTLECGIRFLTDYLNGDVYFKINDKEQNLRRTRTQLKMVQDMERYMPRMKEIIINLIK